MSRTRSAEACSPENRHLVGDDVQIRLIILCEKCTEIPYGTGRCHRFSTVKGKPVKRREYS